MRIFVAVVVLTAFAAITAFVGGAAGHFVIDMALAGWELGGRVIN